MTAICYSVVTFVVIAAILFITWAFFRIADIPLKIARLDISKWENSDKDVNIIKSPHPLYVKSKILYYYSLVKHQVRQLKIKK